MVRIVVLDATPLNLLTMRPGQAAIGDRCRAWADALLDAGSRLVVPGVADYEVRRELVRRGATARIRLLDAFGAAVDFLPVDQAALARAATLWAAARNAGLATAHPAALDGDVIVVAQAEQVAGAGDTVVIATSNPNHLARFADARDWETIT